MEGSDLAVLVTLDALLQEGSVTGAAQRLGLSTPAVSHALAKLRARFSDELLVRSGRGMVLTPRAESLRARVHDAMAAAGRVFEDDHAFDPSRVRRSFRIRATDYVLHVFGAEFDRVVGESSPGIDLRFVPNGTTDAEDLRSGEAELAIGIYGDLPPELMVKPIITDRHVCVVRADHPRINKRLTLQQFVELEHIQIAPRGRPGGYVDEVLAARGLKRRVARAVPYFRSALDMAARSERLLTVSERIARSLAGDLKLQIYEVPLELEPFALSMVWHPRFHADGAHRWVRERLVEVTRAADGLAHRQARRRLCRNDPTTRRRARMNAT